MLFIAMCGQDETKMLKYSNKRFSACDIMSHEHKEFFQGMGREVRAAVMPVFKLTNSLPTRGCSARGLGVGCRY